MENQTHKDFVLKNHRGEWVRKEFRALSNKAYQGANNIPLEGDEVKAVADLSLLCFLSEGVNHSRWVRHVLIEGVNGTGKSVLAKSVARAIAGDALWDFLDDNPGLFDQLPQIVGHPGLMPQDIVGSDSLANQGSHQSLKFFPGPLLQPSLMLFADEFNRIPPPSQNAMLQAMASSEVSIVTVDESQAARTKQINDDFGLFVIAAQNPDYHEGTFPLLEALMDRFLVKTVMHYTDELEKLLVRQPRTPRKPHRQYTKSEVSKKRNQFANLLSDRRRFLQELRDEIAKVNTSKFDGLAAALTYATWPRSKAIRDLGTERNIPTNHRIAAATKNVRAGVSPRGTQALQALAQARAWANSDGDQVEVAKQDLLQVLVPVFRHRILIDPAGMDDLLDAGIDEPSPSSHVTDGAEIARIIRDTVIGEEE